MLNYNVRISNLSNNIILPIKNNFDFMGNDKYINSDELIDKEIEDLEIKKLTLSNSVNLIFNFFNGVSYVTDFITAGFTAEEINLSNRGYRYSYILYQIYDTFETKNQVNIHNGFIPIYLFPDKTFSIFNINPNNRYYEFNNIYIPNNIILEQDQELYINFKFYNAKIGKLFMFFNNTITSNTEDKMYHKITVDKENNTYAFNQQIVSVFQFLNEEYIERLNQRSVNENKNAIYTTGTIFDINGNYA